MSTEPHATAPTARIGLNDGTTIPQVGFGTLNVPPDRTPTPENTAKTAAVVSEAIELGYRLIDTAQMYGNERGVGDAVASSGLPREDLYITSKLGNANHRPDDVRRSFDETMAKLRLDHLDLFLIHWPLPTLHDGDFVSTWEAMAGLLDDGRVRSVGVSNFQPAHLDRIVDATGIVPVVNQIEVHPHFRNDSARAASTRYSIAVEAWSPLAQGRLLEDRTIAEIASDRNRTPAQVILRWHVQHGHVVIPKSTNVERMRRNLELFDFELDAGEIARIDGLDRGSEGRNGPDPDTFDWIPDPATLEA
jgi:2,5-diketo-D-gluconate reductase A